MAEQVLSERPALDRSARRVALIVAAAFFIQHLDGAIINTSLPQLAESFAVQPVDINIGKDLQYIRFNGTLIGGLAGLTLHGVEVLIRSL